MTGLLARIKTGVLAALVFVVALFGVWRAGRTKGKQDQINNQNYDTLREQANADKQVAEVHNEINKLPDGGANDLLRRKWMRRKD